MRVGVAKREITCLLPGIGMLGWSMHFNKAESVHMPLYVRAFVVEPPATRIAEGLRRLAIVHCEIAFITPAVRREVLAALATHHPQLNIGEQELLLTANHTHSAPGGYPEYALFNITIPGFAPKVLHTIVSGCVEAIAEAAANLAPARLRYGSGRFADDIPVAFNRAWKAHSANHDTDHFDQQNWHRAVDRTMRQLHFDTVDGLPLGVLNWFAVHTTNIHNDKRTISPDNKGWAAHRYETEEAERREHLLPQHPGFMAKDVSSPQVRPAEVPRGSDASRLPPFVAGFLQACAGDVTPNFQRFRKMKFTRGVSPDDYESMRINGNFQYELARRIAETAPAVPDDLPTVDGILRYYDMTNIRVRPEFAFGKRDARTGKAVMGLAFMNGTREGEGVHGFLPWLAGQLTLANTRPSPETHAGCIPIIEISDRKIAGTSVDNVQLPGFLHPDVKVIAEWSRKKAFGPQPLAPTVLPVQLLILGPVAIAALPGEATTQVGRRIRATLLPILQQRGVQEVIVQGYSNSYSGYITTYEEYQLQHYEGASTYFGQWTAAAYRQLLHDLALELLRPPAERTPDPGLRPPVFAAETLEKRRYVPRSYTGKKSG